MDAKLTVGNGIFFWWIFFEQFAEISSSFFAGLALLQFGFLSHPDLPDFSKPANLVGKWHLNASVGDVESLSAPTTGTKRSRLSAHGLSAGVYAGLRPSVNAERSPARPMPLQAR